MKILKDMNDIERVGEILVECFVNEKQLNESAAKLLISKSSLLLESGPTTTPTQYVVKNRYVVTLDTFIKVYVEYDQFPEPEDMMRAFNIPLDEWDMNDRQKARKAMHNMLSRSMANHFRKTAEGKKWIFPTWSDRRKYSYASANSIHPDRVGHGKGITADPNVVDFDAPEEKWDELEMLDRGDRNKRNRSTSIIDTFNKAEIAKGEFYNNISRIRPSIWGSIWRKEKAQVQSDRGSFFRKWKKVFVLGYQIDRNLFYEIWYGTMDGMFSLHDHRGNQISRKFPTMSEVTKALTNAIVQTSKDDAEIFMHGGANRNKIAASIVTALNSETDTMVKDLMAIEDKEEKKREAILRKKRMDDAKAKAEWDKKVDSIRSKARSTTQRAKGVGKSAYESGKKILINGILSDNDVSAIQRKVREGAISEKTARYFTQMAKASVTMTKELIDKIANDFNVSKETAAKWNDEFKHGGMGIEEFVIKVEMEKDSALRAKTSSDMYNAMHAKNYRSPWSVSSRPEPADSNKPETVFRPTTVAKHMGFQDISTAQAEREILNSGIPPYAETVGNDKDKIRAYIATLLNDKTYAHGRTQKEEIQLITLDVYGRIEMLGTVSSMVSNLKKKGVIVREGFDYSELGGEEKEPELFDIDDELESRYGATIEHMRRNSEKVAMTINDLKYAINNDYVQLYSKTRLDESMWANKFRRILNRGRKVPIALPTDKPSITQRVKMFFQGSRYRADFVTGLSISERVNIEIWYVTEPNPNANVFDGHGVKDSEFHGRTTISSFYVFDVTSGTLVRSHLPYHKNALQVAMAKLGVV